MVPTPERKRRSSGADERKPDRIRLRGVEGIVESRPVDVVDRIAPRAAMFVCVEGDDVTPADHAIRLYEKAARPKKILVQRNTSHYSAYDDYFEEVTSQTVDWFDRHVRRGDIESKEATNDHERIEYLP